MIVTDLLINNNNHHLGAITSIFGMFFGGGGPSTEEVLKDEFKKQKEFIEKQFKEQETFMEKLMTRTQLENVQSKALGVLDALESRHAYIFAFEGMATCLSEDVINQATLRVEYFMDESSAQTIKHAFDMHCQEILTSAEKRQSQVVCSLLIYTYLTIEVKRHEILIIMMGLLSNSERFEELTMGYLNVQEYQRERLTKWLTTTIGDNYCAIFVYHKAVWNGKEKQLEETLDIIGRFAPKLEDVKADCERGNFSNIF